MPLLIKSSVNRGSPVETLLLLIFFLLFRAQLSSSRPYSRIASFAAPSLVRIYILHETPATYLCFSTWISFYLHCISFVCCDFALSTLSLILSSALLDARQTNFMDTTRKCALAPFTTLPHLFPFVFFWSFYLFCRSIANGASALCPWAN